MTENFSTFFKHCSECGEEKTFTRSNQSQWHSVGRGENTLWVCPDCVKRLKTELNNCQTPGEIAVFLDSVREALDYAE